MSILSRIEALEFKIKEPEPHVLRRALDTLREIPGTDHAIIEYEELSREQAVLGYNESHGSVGPDYQERRNEFYQRADAVLIEVAERYALWDLAAWARSGYPPTWPELD